MCLTIDNSELGHGRNKYFSNKLSQPEGWNCERTIAEPDGVPGAQPLFVRIAKTGDGYLIDGLPAGTRDEKRGHSLGNRFSDVKSEQPLPKAERSDNEAFGPW